MPSIDVNLLAVIIAAVMNTMIGAAWFNAPFLFNRGWLAGIGKTAEEVAAGFSPLQPLLSFVGALVSAYILALFAGWSGVEGLSQGLLTGALVGLGFSAIPVTVKDMFEGRPRTLMLIHAGHDIVVFAVMGAVIALI